MQENALSTNKAAGFCCFHDCIEYHNIQFAYERCTWSNLMRSSPPSTSIRTILKIPSNLKPVPVFIFKNQRVLHLITFLKSSCVAVAQRLQAAPRFSNVVVIEHCLRFSWICWTNIHGGGQAVHFIPAPLSQ